MLNFAAMSTVAEPQCVFVYGTLMRGYELHRYLERAEFVGAGTIEGALVSLGSYPGLVDGRARVRGEVYRFDDLPAALDVLDDVEDFNPTDADASLFVRRVALARMDAGPQVDAWVYYYNRPHDGAPKIASGDWRKRES